MWTNKFKLFSYRLKYILRKYAQRDVRAMGHTLQIAFPTTAL
jgi:hypothetical protein